jgi:hypothetical protein
MRVLSDRLSTILWGSAILGSLGAFAGICLSCAINIVSGGVCIALVLGLSFLLVHQFAPSHRMHSARRRPALSRSSVPFRAIHAFAGEIVLNRA